MAVLLVLAAFAVTAVAFTVALVGIVLGGLFRLILLPFFLLKWILTGVVMLIVGPILAIVALVLALVFGVVVAIPLLPLLLLGLLVWLIVRSTQRPVAA